MKLFYKYTSFERGRYILRNRCLPLGHKSNYNDPYECAIDGFDEEVMSFLGHMSEDQKKEWIKYVINKIADKENWSKEMRMACDVRKDIKTLIRRKSKMWEYEQECRFFFNAKDHKNQIIWYDHHDNPVIPLGDGTIKKVIFGTRVPNEKISLLKEKISLNKCSAPITFQQAKLCETGFGLEFPDK